MTIFWIIRHGQTDWNLEGRYQGIKDTPLNETGLCQAEMAADRVTGINFEAIYSSPLKRAYRTAEAVARRQGLDILVDDRLLEISQGVWEGMLFSDIEKQYPELISKRKKNPLNAQAPGGETVLEVAERIKKAVEDIAGKHPQGPVLLVSHGLALAVFKCLALNIPLREVHQYIPENAEPEKIEWNNID